MNTRTLRKLLILATAVVICCGISTRAHAAETLCDPSFQDCRTPLLSLIDKEAVEIDVGFWFMEDQRYVSHIIARKNAGVTVRLIVDPRANPSYPLNQTSLDTFQKAGIPMMKKTAGGIMHWKTMIFGGQHIVEFGSANYSPNAFVPVTPYTNYVSETVFFEDDPAIVQSFMRKFDDLWIDTGNYSVYANVSSRVRSYPLYSISADMNFPPGQSYTTRLVNLENVEKQKIDVDMYRISQQAHSDALIAAHKRGIPVRYMGETLEYRDASRLWVAWNMDRMYAAGVPMRVRASEGENHEKLTLLYGQATAVFGSANFTGPSDNSQQEHNYFTKKSALFTWFEDQFNRKWNNSHGVTETTPFVPLPPDKPVNKSITNGDTGVPTAAGQKLVWYGGPWAHVYDVYFGTDSSASTLFAANLALGPSETTTENQSLTLPALAPATTYYWKIVSKTAANVSRAGSIWSFTTAGSGGGGGALPSPWADRDVGTVSMPGSASYSGGTFTISAEGDDIWGTTDQFHYVYQPLSGDGSIVARVDTVQQAAAWSKTGVMIRETLAAGSKHANMLVSAAKGVAFQWRPTTNGASQNATGSASAPPRWMKLVRSGSTFTGYESANGTSWTKVGTATISMGTNVFVGLAVTSHNTSAFTASTISQVTIGGAISSLPAPWTDGDIGSVPIAGHATASNGTFTITGSGADIWGTADAFHYVYQPLTGDATIVARVDSVQHADVWSKAGVMIRESLSAGSRHALVLASAAKGVAFQWRGTTGGTSSNISGSTSAPPRWVGLVRSGNTFTAYESADGSTWTAIGSTSISMTPSTVYIGLAVTSHSTTASTTATINGVTVQ